MNLDHSGELRITREGTVLLTCPNGQESPVSWLENGVRKFEKYTSSYGGNCRTRVCWMVADWERNRDAVKLTPETERTLRVDNTVKEDMLWSVSFSEWRKVQTRLLELANCHSPLAALDRLSLQLDNKARLIQSLNNDISELKAVVKTAREAAGMTTDGPLKDGESPSLIETLRKLRQERDDQRHSTKRWSELIEACHEVAGTKNGDYLVETIRELKRKADSVAPKPVVETNSIPEGFKVSVRHCPNRLNDYGMRGLRGFVDGIGPEMEIEIEGPHEQASITAHRDPNTGGFQLWDVLATICALHRKVP